MPFLFSGGVAMSAYRCIYCNNWLSEKEIVETIRKVRLPKRVNRAHALQTFKASDSDIPELKDGLCSTGKHNWLIDHREEILAYREEYGEAEARRHYGVAQLDGLQVLETVSSERKGSNTRAIEFNAGESHIRLTGQLTDKQLLEIKVKVLEDEVHDLRRKLYGVNAVKQEPSPDLGTGQVPPEKQKPSLALADMYDVAVDGNLTLKWHDKTSHLAGIPAGPAGEKPPTINEVCRIAQTEYWNDRERRDRFVAGEVLSPMANVRLSFDDMELLKSYVITQNKTRSEVCRDIIHDFLQVKGKLPGEGASDVNPK
jgi:hypothetical protein